VAAQGCTALHCQSVRSNFNQCKIQSGVCHLDVLTVAVETFHQAALGNLQSHVWNVLTYHVSATFDVYTRNTATCALAASLDAGS
jgi:hypothetical protein